MKLLNATKSTKSKVVITRTSSEKYHPSELFPILYRDGNGLNIGYAENEEDLISLGFYENAEYSVFVHKDSKISNLELNENIRMQGKGSPYRKFSNNVKRRISGSKKSLIKIGAESPTDSISENKGYTFGVEIETCSGAIPQFRSKELNIKSEYDGSIYSNNGRKAYGGEYVTGILKGDAGFLHLNKILSTLNTYCEINKTCSVHVHLGNINFNKENIVFLWIVLKALEDQIFETVPSSRRDNSYCNRIDEKGLRIAVDKYDYYNSIEKSYSNIVKIISLGKENGQTINKSLNHPAGRSCGYNKRTPRYWWINFVPTLFSISGIKGHTIEIRIHGASMNYKKIRNLILMFMGIASFAENNKKEIMDGDYNLSSVMKSSFRKKGAYLAEYLESRKKLFANPRSRAESREYADREMVPIKFKSIL